MILTASLLFIPSTLCGHLRSKSANKSLIQKTTISNSNYLDTQIYYLKTSIFSERTMKKIFFCTSTKKITITVANSKSTKYPSITEKLKSKIIYLTNFSLKGILLMYDFNFSDNYSLIIIYRISEMESKLYKKRKRNIFNKHIFSVTLIFGCLGRFFFVSHLFRFYYECFTW